MGRDAWARRAASKSWVSTPRVFRQFLAWLDEDIDSGGERYLEMRRRLIAYFQRKRCVSPDELADDTLTRVARRLEEEGAIRGVAPPQYCYITAKFVFLEYLRRAEHVPLPDLPAADEVDAPKKEHLLDCLDRCLAQLSASERELILEYYRNDQRGKIGQRRAYAARLGISSNALTIRACRIREKLEACVNSCSSVT